jgi:hypothetical protein
MTCCSPALSVEDSTRATPRGSGTGFRRKSRTKTWLSRASREAPAANQRFSALPNKTGPAAYASKDTITPLKTASAKANA